MPTLLPQTVEEVRQYLPSPNSFEEVSKMKFDQYCSHFSIDPQGNKEFWEQVYNLRDCVSSEEKEENLNANIRLSETLRLQLMGPKKSSDISVVDRIIVEILIKDVKYQAEVAELLLDLKRSGIFNEAILNRLKDRGNIRMMSSKETRYPLEKIISGTDTFGKYDFDIFRGLLDINIMLPHGKTFPTYWRTSSNTIVTVLDHFTVLVDELTQQDNQQFKYKIKERINYNSITLLEWLQAIITMKGKTGINAETFHQLLVNHWVFTIEDLKEWRDKDWEANWLNPNAKIMLRDAITEAKASQEEEYKGQTRTKNESAQLAFAFGSIHMIKRYFYFHAKKIKQVPLLCSKAIDYAFKALEYKGEALLNNIKQRFFKVFEFSTEQGVSIPRGLLLYGPPGTGKTTITEHVGELVGFYQIVPPISSTEVNRSLVGETEKLLLDMCNRAKLVPHLPASISIDEIDNLAPKRNDDSNTQGKKDALAILLAVIGGIKNVENLVFLASTNFRDNIDEAFLRRMRGQFFVGRPDAENRVLFLQKALSSFVISNADLTILTVLTCNFTGAALKELSSDIIVRMKDENPNSRNLDMNIAKQCAVQVCQQFPSLLLGQHNIPELLSANPNARLSIDMNSSNFSGKVICDLTNLNGKMLFEKKECSISATLNYTTNLAQVLPFITSFAVRNNIEFIQLLDADVLLRKSAFDEKSTKETLNECISEVNEYNKTITIFDVDSLAGVSMNKSDSNMVTSNSISITNNNILNLVMHFFSSAHVEKEKKRIMIIVSSQEFLITTIRNMSKFKQTEQEEQQEREQIENMQAKVCKTCRKMFNPADSVGKLDCSYHPGYLYDENFLKVPKSQAISHLLSDNLKYICCKNSFNSAGCRNCDHNHVCDMSEVVLDKEKITFDLTLEVMLEQKTNQIMYSNSKKKYNL